MMDSYEEYLQVVAHRKAVAKAWLDRLEEIIEMYESLPPGTKSDDARDLLIHVDCTHILIDSWKKPLDGMRIQQEHLKRFIDSELIPKECWFKCLI